jgi:lipopolysaccharide export system permease protein
VARNVSIQEFQGSFVLHRIDVPRMEWVSDHWELVNGISRKFSATGERATTFKRQSRRDLLFKPDDLAKTQLEPEEMSSMELRAFIEEVRRGGGNTDRWETDLYLKFAFPFSNLIIVLIGASLAANKQRSGAAMGFGISLLVCFLYFGLIKTGQSMGYTGALPPKLAPWIGNIVFFIIGNIMLLRTRT